MTKREAKIKAMKIIISYELIFLDEYDEDGGVLEGAERVGKELTEILDQLRKRVYKLEQNTKNR